MLRNQYKIALRLLRCAPKIFSLPQIRSIHNYDEIYAQTKSLFLSKKLPQNVNKSAVFACNELDLEEIQVYGFDYDYTLACYKKSLHYLLYELARDQLVEKYKYPEAIKHLKYDPQFAIRGLHYDIERGLLLKLDSFLQIQLGSVYRGLTPVSDAEVIRLYRNRSIPLAYVEGSSKTQYGRGKMVQLADLFSVPEISLLCNVAEYFENEQLNYHPEILFRDVKRSMGACHPVMHGIVAQDVDKYIEASPQLEVFFKRLKAANKQLFLVTNSPYHFVNQGMNMLVGQNWKDYFDIVIVQARKPRFFTDESRPFRVFDTQNGTHLWDRVSKLDREKTYFEGTVKELQSLMNWFGNEVLYFGDHPYSDLADATLEHGWRTGAIISELDHEIDTLNNEEFKTNANWLQMLTQLIEDYQDNDTEAAHAALLKWNTERDQLRQATKKVFNKQFGSAFRTYNNPTYFSRRLFRFSDIYTSNISNLMDYSVKHTFYPRRGVMPHEYSSLFL